ncbi:N-acetylgalactosamine-6-sulfatase, partial [Clarias magur]
MCMIGFVHAARYIPCFPLPHIHLSRSLSPSVLSKEYLEVQRRINAVVEQHKKTLLPGEPQLNMCDLAVMGAECRFETHPAPQTVKHGRQSADICPILKEPKALASVTDLFEEYVKQNYPQTQLIV